MQNNKEASEREIELKEISKFELKTFVPVSEEFELEDILKIFNIVVVGDGCVGKTSLIRRFCKDEYQHYQQTSGPACFSSKVFEIGGNKLTLLIDDLPGQEEYQKFRFRFSYPADAVILTMKLSSSASFENLKAEWLPEILDHHQKAVPIILVVTFLAGKEKKVTDEQLQFFAKENGLIGPIYTNAQTGDNVHIPFEKIASILCNPFKLYISKIVDHLESEIDRLGQGDKYEKFTALSRRAIGCTTLQEVNELLESIKIVAKKHAVDPYSLEGFLRLNLFKYPDSYENLIQVLVKYDPLLEQAKEAEQERALVQKIELQTMKFN
jgi:small GTP-binding protein